VRDLSASRTLHLLRHPRTAAAVPLVALALAVAGCGGATTANSAAGDGAAGPGATTEATQAPTASATPSPAATPTATPTPEIPVQPAAQGPHNRSDTEFLQGPVLAHHAQIPELYERFVVARLDDAGRSTLQGADREVADYLVTWIADMSAAQTREMAWAGATLDAWGQPRVPATDVHAGHAGGAASMGMLTAADFTRLEKEPLPAALRDFLRLLKVHHGGMVTHATGTLQGTDIAQPAANPDVRKAAQEAINGQGKEIRQIDQLLLKLGEDPAQDSDDTVALSSGSATVHVHTASFSASATSTQVAGSPARPAGGRGATAPATVSSGRTLATV
jgi:uncharacterized protein (DUF305 family)